MHELALIVSHTTARMSGRANSEAGVFRATSAALEQEKRVSELQTYGMRLDEYFQQLNNISTQTTLLLGFVLAAVSSETLSGLISHTGFIR